MAFLFAQNLPFGATAGYAAPEMKILVTGATGMIGSELVPFLLKNSHEVRRLTRRPSEKSDIGWNPDSGSLVSSEIEGFDAVIHLAGENIASGRWTAARKKRILDSRKNGTRLLCQKLAGLTARPTTLISVSGVNFYPDHASCVFDETGSAGISFLALVCREWEAATSPARDAGIRVVNLRLGVVLCPAGGALAKMMPVFKLGLGGRIGHGRQHMSWISIDDLLEVMDFCLSDERIEGVVNAVAPQTVSNRDFTRALAKALGRPSVFPVPAIMIKLLFGQMGEETILSDLRVYPKKLLEYGYKFRHESLSDSLTEMLYRPQTETDT